MNPAAGPEPGPVKRRQPRVLPSFGEYPYYHSMMTRTRLAPRADATDRSFFPP